LSNRVRSTNPTEKRAISFLALGRKKLENKGYKNAPNSALSMEGYLKRGFEHTRAMTHENMNNSTYLTSDLWLAAFLKAKGLKIIRVEGSNRKASFVFEDTPERKDLIEEFYNNGPIGITIIKNAMLDLKSAIFNMD